MSTEADVDIGQKGSQPVLPVFCVTPCIHGSVWLPVPSPAEQAAIIKQVVVGTGPRHAGRHCGYMHQPHDLASLETHLIVG